jgi:hypothetical protein
MPCPNFACQWWRGESPAALDAAVLFDGGRVVELPDKTAAMLKAARIAALAPRARVMNITRPFRRSARP